LSDEPRTELVPARVADRVFARLVDGVLLLPVALFTALLPEATALVVSIAVSGAYEIGFITARGQTPGKRFVGLKVLHYGYDALPAPSQAALRYLLLQIAGWVAGFGSFEALRAVGLSWPWVLLVTAMVHPLHRGWHDRIAGTIVVDVDEPSPLKSWRDRRARGRSEA
jgi:uncharacterized RDD family membrane protein YckC